MTNRYQMIRTEQPMTNDQLRAAAPSIFAMQPWHAMSDRYTFIPTSAVVDRMREEGFQPVAAMQSRTRIAGKGEFTKHVVRFRDMRAGSAPATRALGVVYPELVLTNSHDGASAYKLDAGLFRLVCTNGMVVSDGEFAQINVRHSGSADGIIEASYQVVEQFPKVIDSAALPAIAAHGARTDGVRDGRARSAVRRRHGAGRGRAVGTGSPVGGCRGHALEQLQPCARASGKRRAPRP